MSVDSLASAPDSGLYVGGLVYVSSLPGQIGAGEADAFVRKYDAFGVVAWTRQFGTQGPDGIEDMAVSTTGDIYVLGFTRHPLPGQQALGGLDGFLRKYDGSGGELWTRQFGSGRDEHAKGVAIDMNSNVYVTGDSIDEKLGELSERNQQAFLRRFDPSGNLAWEVEFGTPEPDEAELVASDAQGHIYVAGKTEGAFDPETQNQGSDDIFLMKYSPSGEQLWVRQFGTSGSDWLGAIAVDYTGRIVVTGYTIDTASGEAFVEVFDQNGGTVWSQRFGARKRTEITSVATETDGSIYVSGSTEGKLGTDPRLDGEDAFLAKFDSNGALLWIRQFGTSERDGVADLALDASGHLVLADETHGTFPGQQESGGYDGFVVRTDKEGDFLRTLPQSSSGK